MPIDTLSGVFPFHGGDFVESFFVCIFIFWMAIKGLDPNWDYERSGWVANLFQVVRVLVGIGAVACTLGIVGHIVQSWFSDKD